MNNKIQLELSQDGSNARVLSVASDGAETAIGTIAKVGGLWRHAQFTDETGKVTASGMGAIHQAIQTITGIFPALVLELHSGYFAMYAGEDLPLARAMEFDGMYAYRCFGEHESAKMPSLQSAIEHAFRGVA